MPEQFKAVIVGCGAMSETWLKAAQAIDAIRMVGFVDVDIDKTHQHAEQFWEDDNMVSDDLEAVLKAKHPDIVFNCTIPAAHYDVTMTALDHDCHVLSEKPLANSMDEARKMVAKAQERGKEFAVIQNRRFEPNIRKLKEFLGSGRLGQLTTINSDFYLAPHFGGFREEMDNVLLLDMAIHTFDAARMLTGADPLNVYCKEWNPVNSWYKHGASAVAIFEMTNGIVYTYRGSWAADGLPTTWESEWRIIGENGTVRWWGDHGIDAQVIAQTGRFISLYNDIVIQEENIPDDLVQGHASVMKQFIESINTGESIETICTDNIKSLAMVFAAIESAKLGREVPVEW